MARKAGTSVEFLHASRLLNHSCRPHPRPLWHTGGCAGTVAITPQAVADTVGAGDTFQAAMLTWLAEQGLQAEGNLILRRQVGADGRSRAFVNDQPINACSALN